MISVIVPVYNVEKYLGRCIESLIKQTCQELEIILIDDGSTDASLEICKQWEKKDQRIRVIHKENGGAPSARNAAIPLAKGKYMYFMDSDDWAEPEMLQDMYDLAEKNNAQYVVTGYYIEVTRSYLPQITDDLNYKIYTKEEYDEIGEGAYHYNFEEFEGQKLPCL